MHVKRPEKISQLMEVVRRHLDNGSYLDTRHALDRKFFRNISRLEVLYVLRNGYHEKRKDYYEARFHAWNYAVSKINNMKQKKIKSVFIDYGFGFPVKLLNVPMVRVRGVWTPDIDYTHLTQTVLKIICEKPVRLTGNEVRFIRLHLGMTLQAFAKRFSVSHVAVMKWESKKHKSTTMNWSTEKDLRLFLLSKLSSHPGDLVALYQDLEKAKANEAKPLQLDIKAIAA